MSYALNPPPEKSYEAGIMPDGVYVDVSFRNDVMTIGVVRYKNGFSEAHSIFCHHKGTDKAECDAIIYAREIYPNEIIYCDHDCACKKMGATYVPRRMNKAAHSAAYKRTNFRRVQRTKFAI